MTRRLLHVFCGAALFALVCGAMMPQQSLSQDKGIEIGGTYSYMWAGTYHLYYGEIQMEDGNQWGGFASFSLRPDTKLELSYLNPQSRMLHTMLTRASRRNIRSSTTSTLR